MWGLLGAMIFGVAAIDDAAKKGRINANNRAHWVADGKPYYPTADNNYIYIPTGEKCSISSEYSWEQVNKSKPRKKVLRSLKTQKIIYYFPEVDRSALLRERMKELGWETKDDVN